MRLYHSPTSPYARKVTVLLAETGQTGAVTLVAVAGTPLDTGTMPLAHNPLGKIPALERAEGGALYDSRVICRYLDDRAGGRLYPPAPRLWDTLTLEATADGILDAAILMVYEARIRPEPLRFADWSRGTMGQDQSCPRHGRGSLAGASGRAARHRPDRAWLRAWLSRFPPRRARLAAGPAGACGLVWRFCRARQHGRHNAGVSGAGSTTALRSSSTASPGSWPPARPAILRPRSRKTGPDDRSGRRVKPAPRAPMSAGLPRH